MNDNRTLTCECGNPKHYRSVGCKQCMEIERERSVCDTRKKVLACVARFDWASTQDIYVALDVAGEFGPEYRRASSMLRRLAQEGLLETRGSNSGTYYRVAQRKRSAIRAA